MDTTFHYPPELFSLLVDTIPRLVRSKKDLLLFFRGAGVPRRLTGDIEARLAQDRDSLNKFEITRSVLMRLNDEGDATLSPRREVLKRVVEFEDYTSCYPDKQLEAEGFVARIRALCNVKDAFTRMNIERERVRQQHQAEEQRRLADKQRRRAELDSIRSELYSLFGCEDPHQRGKRLEGVLNRLFEHAGLLLREAFTRVGDRGEGIVEQIDGVVALDSKTFLVEMKWHDKPLGVPEVAPHLVRVYGRADANGMIISASGFSDAAVATCKDALAQKIIVLCDLNEIINLLEEDGDLQAMLRRKTQAAVIDRVPLFRGWSVRLTA